MTFAATENGGKKMSKNEAIAYGAYKLDQVIRAIKMTNDYVRLLALEKEKVFLLAAMAALEEVDENAAD